jgi:glucose/arabinose dehydrogenase
MPRPPLRHPGAAPSTGRRPAPRRGVLLAGIAALALGLAACPADDEPAAPPTPAAPAPATPTPATPAPTPAATPAETPTPSPEPTPATDEPVDIDESVVAAGLEAPWDVAFTADGRTFVTERDSGRLLELDDAGAASEVQTLPIDPAGEGGLLGLTTDSDGETLYAYYTSAEDNRVVRFAPGDEPEPILTGIPKAQIHNGGRVAFGPDGMLYVTTGDAADPGLSQDPDSLAGKILRVTPDGALPDDNPDPGSPVYAAGIRNSQGLAWDAGERLIIAEFGPNVDDAVLRVEAGSDQGWGADTAAAPAGARPFPDPIDVRQPPDASWSGAGVLRDGAIPQWEGDLFVTALRGERLWRYALDEDGGVAEIEELLVGEYGRLRQPVQAPDGSLWVLTSNRDGRGSPAADDDRIIRLGPPG